MPYRYLLGIFLFQFSPFGTKIWTSEANAGADVLIGQHLQNRYSGKSRNFVKILFSGVRSLYDFAEAGNSVSDWDCADCDVWNGI